ncbi:MAG: sensor histidine kinase, partial [Pseudarthrobacter sp.]|nr:sensor histidine kinase [Pseudarthrobacter sp.]
MPDSPLLTAAAVAVIAMSIAVVVAVGLKVLRSFRDLGTDAERATYHTLHAASQAGQHLRRGLNPAGAAKASRQLRALLGCEALAITDTAGVLAWDGAADDAGTDLMELAASVLASGRAAVLPAGPEGTGGALAAVIAPVRAGSRVAGAVAAFAPAAGAGLVRATGEEADWVAAQVE